MIDLLSLHKQFILTHVKEGDICADFTMGNGYDTEFLARTVGMSGKVYAFDIQPAAVESTKKRLAEVGCPENYTLICDSHHNAAKYIDCKIKGGMFNLGWLPGAEHGVMTLTETTLQAANAALDILREDGLMTICIYPGHEEGERELNALMRWASGLDSVRYDVLLKTYLNQPNDPPQMIAVRKKKTKKSKISDCNT